jgi:hypothetical protein
MVEYKQDLGILISFDFSFLIGNLDTQSSLVEALPFSHTDSPTHDCVATEQGDSLYASKLRILSMSWFGLEQCRPDICECDGQELNMKLNFNIKFGS